MVDSVKVNTSVDSLNAWPSCQTEDLAIQYYALYRMVLPEMRKSCPASMKDAGHAK
jgi:hypothetical protein